MPAALNLARAHEDDLVVLFVQSQGLSSDESEAFALGRKWLGTQAMWTSERPFSTGSRGLPSFALVSSNGEILLKGNPLAVKKELEEAIKSEIARSRKAPDSVPRSLKGAWTDFAKGKYAKALAAARKAIASGGEDAESAEETLEVFERRLDSRIRRISWMIENGRYLDALDRLETLGKAIRGAEEYESRIEELRSQLKSSELAPEIAAAKTLARIEKKLHAEGPEPRIIKELEKFAGRKAGTKAAERARRLVALATQS